MTVAVACNLSEGVILGVDSAVTVPADIGIIKVYENADKLFQLGEKPIGVAVFGLGSLGVRSIGSYIREFELENPNNVVTGHCEIKEVVEALRAFFSKAYHATITPALEQATGKTFADIDPEQIPLFGLVVGGFSSGAYLSEVWAIYVPVHSTPYSAICQLGQGRFASSWFATYEPIRRYIKGYDPALLSELLEYFQVLRGKKFDPTESQKIAEIAAKYEFPILFDAMPMAEGIAHTRFLVELVINHHRFGVGAPIVGGKARIGTVTYTGEKFRILSG